MLPHFAESLRELGRLGGGLDDDGEVDSQPWLLGCAQVVLSWYVSYYSSSLAESD